MSKNKKTKHSKNTIRNKRKKMLVCFITAIIANIAVIGLYAGIILYHNTYGRYSASWPVALMTAFLVAMYPLSFWAGAKTGDFAEKTKVHKTIRTFASCLVYFPWFLAFVYIFIAMATAH